MQDYNIPIPDTFVVPTKVGGVQFEWDIEDRELELEVVDKNNFKYLAIINENEKEGASSRWQLRLLRWVITGEEI